MKHLTVLLMAIAICCAKFTKEIQEDCRKENGLSEEEARSLDKDEVLSQAKKCNIKCTFEKSGYIAQNGDIVVEQMRSDGIADGDEKRLNKVYGCLSKLKTVKSCDDIPAFVDCFEL